MGKQRYQKEDNYETHGYCDTAIIGAGAAGLMAAVSAARAGGKPVLFEHMDAAAKKLPATGNGRCNYTNADQALANYYCAEPGFVETVLTQFSYEDTIHFFEELGIRPVQKNGTCIYPESGQASSVRSALLAEAERLHIPILCGVGIRMVKLCRQDKRDRRRALQAGMRGRALAETVFVIEAKGQTFYSRTCILAAGGKAAAKTGSDGSGYLYAKQLGHSIVPPLPALCALHADFNKWKLPAGVRIECAAALFIDGGRAALERGELQITDYGLSGIVIFQFSRFAAKALAEGSQVRVMLDFKPDMALQELADYLDGRFHSPFHAQKTAAACMNGFVPDKLSVILLKRAGIAPASPCRSCKKTQAAQLAALLKNYETDITGTNAFDGAQVTAGGIPAAEIDARTMQSRLVPGLYFAGEMVDVDAKCGGYNLQWAWASGSTAGRAAAAVK